MLKAHLITAIVTPFNENDEIDYTVLENLTNHLIQQGSDGFVIGGTTGEGPTLTPSEKKRHCSPVLQKSSATARL